MFRRSMAAAALTVAVLMPVSAHADSAAIKNKLSGTPATLWDLTLVRVEAALASWVGGDGINTSMSMSPPARRRRPNARS
jgi:hypothetical protein